MEAHRPEPEESWQNRQFDEQPEVIRECSTCKFNEPDLTMNPCITCNASLHYWQLKSKEEQK